MTRLILFLAALLTPHVFSLAAEESGASATKAPQMVRANQLAEWSFTTDVNRSDPFNQVTLDALFTEPGGTERRVPAFWAGGQTWKVRYASPVVGTHMFRTECSDDRDIGLHGVTGSAEVEPYTGDHPLYSHGPLRVTDGKRYLEHADGTPFLWLGDTWWMGLTKRLSFPDEFNTLLADRKAKGFNVVQIVAGLYPDMPAFDERGANEAGFPWAKEYARIRPEYFDRADERIMRLVDEGFVPCIVGAWGYHLPWLEAEKMKRHQRYLYARWGALPIVWCVAGETNLPYYLNPGFPHGGKAQTRGWEDVVRYCQAINAFGRPITSHPTGIAPMSMRGVLDDAPALLDFDMLQTGHGQLEVIPQTVEAVRFSYRAKPPMPVVNGEPAYEMLNDTIPADIARMVFWVCWANGVKGYTYGANGIWQLNGKDKPYGNSPWGGSYGKISWQKAMNLAGSTHVSLGKRLLEQYPWHKLEPQPTWAAWADEPLQDVSLGEWIWSPEGEPATDAAAAARHFRRTFELPPDATVTRAVLRITADDRCTVWLNGQELGSHGNWRTLRQFDAVADKLRAGRNVLAVRAENVKADVPQNPAGLAGALVVELADGKRIEVPTGPEWRVSRDQPEDWQEPQFDDGTWPEAKALAPFGAPPWGKIDAPGENPYLVPYTMGIAGQLRILYMPTPKTVVVKQLEPNVRYTATHFDPVSGEARELGDVQPNADRSWRCETPQTAHDWVLVLEAKQ